jgi:hypothetical protein
MSKYSVTTLVAVLVLAGAAVPARADMLSATRTVIAIVADGTAATFQFKRLTIFTGFGAGDFGHGSLSFVYGLGPLEAAPYLKLPAGKKLMHNGVQLALADL